MPIPLINIADYEARARETMPRAVFDPVFGAYGQPGFFANTANLEAFDALKLAPRVLVGSFAPKVPCFAKSPFDKLRANGFSYLRSW